MTTSEPPNAASPPSPAAPPVESYTGVLHAFGEGFHVMCLAEAEREGEDGTPAVPMAREAVVAVTYGSTALRAAAVNAIGSRVRVHGLAERSVVIAGVRGARVLADVLVHVLELRDLGGGEGAFARAHRPRRR